jgi:hypothetical protein
LRLRTTAGQQLGDLSDPRHVPGDRHIDGQGRCVPGSHVEIVHRPTPADACDRSRARVPACHVTGDVEGRHGCGEAHARCLENGLLARPDPIETPLQFILVKPVEEATFSGREEPARNRLGVQDTRTLLQIDAHLAAAAEGVEPERARAGRVEAQPRRQGWRKLGLAVGGDPEPDVCHRQVEALGQEQPQPHATSHETGPVAIEPQTPRPLELLLGKQGAFVFIRRSGEIKRSLPQLDLDRTVRTREARRPNWHHRMASRL